MWCLTPISITFQLYRVGKFQWWRERENIWGKLTKPDPSGSKDKWTNPDIQPMTLGKLVRIYQSVLVNAYEYYRFNNVMVVNMTWFPVTEYDLNHK